MRRGLVLIGTLLLGEGLVCPAQTTPAFDMLNRNIVKVRVHRNARGGETASDETGTGLVVTIIAGNPTTAGTARVLTAAHVISGASSVTVTFVTDKAGSLPATVMPSSSDALDLGMLEVRLPRGAMVPEKFMQLHVLSNGMLRQAEHVWTVNGEWDPVPNTIVHLDHGTNAQQFEYTKVSVGEGYSGAPVFDDGGRLVGIHTSETRKGDYTLAVAVKAESVVETLTALQYSRTSLNALVPDAAAPTVGSRVATNPAGGVSVPVKQTWRNLSNNQLYLVRVDGPRMYIAENNGRVVADLAIKEDKKGGKKFVGTSSLSNCPNGGYMEIGGVSDTRIDGRIEFKPSNGQCGGVLGIMRQLSPIAFLREQ